MASALVASSMRVGVTAVQGDVSEHLDAVDRALEELGRSGRAFPVRRPDHVEASGALIIPGGESTAISKLLVQFGLHEPIVRRGEEGLPIMGTCAGCILLAKEGDAEVLATETRLLGLMDMAVDRNAFGRQRESFEADLEVDGLGAVRGVFIRAPAIRRVWGGCAPLCLLEDRIVMARQGPLLGLAFHPELSGTTAIHRLFLELV